MKLPAQWRLRLADLAIVAGAWALVSEVWFSPPLGATPYALLVFLWAAGLNLSRTYRGDGSLSEVAGKLTLDHLLVTGVWVGALRVLGIRPDLMEVIVFSLLSLAALALARVVLRQGRRGGVPLPSLILGEALLGLIGFYALDGLEWDLRVPAGLLATFVLSRTLVPWMLRLHLRPEPAAAGKAWLTWLLGQALGTALIVAIGAGTAWPQTGQQLIVGAGLLPLVLGGLYRAFRLYGPGARAEPESARRVALGATAFGVIHPYFSASMAGTGDAKLYGEAMQDYLGQLHAGIFPVFVSQTDVAPFGSVFPFRMAAYHFFIGALLDRLTGMSLGVYAVQHLTLIVSAFAGAYAMYATLTALAPERRWESVALSFLYLTCPGWLAGLYGADMYFTYMTLPWLPLVMYATVLTFRRGDLKYYAWLGGALSLTWLAHPPIGFWASVVAAAAQLARLIVQRPTGRDLARYGVAAATFAVLTAGLLVSLYDARVRGESMDGSVAVLASLRSAMPQALLPVSARGDRLGDFQIGYAFLALLALAAFRRGSKPAPEQLPLVAIAVFLLVITYPIPGLTPALWRTMPRVVALISNVWPMQRIYPVLAAVIPLAALPVLSCLGGARARAAVLGLLCAWSGFEAAPFVRRGYLITHTAVATRLASRLENSPLLPNWTAYMAHVASPPLVSRVSDPRLLNRLLDASGRKELISNFSVAAGGPTPSPTDPADDAVPLQPGVMLISPRVILQPGQRYQLTLYFSPGAPSGLFQLLTLKDADFRFYQEIPLGAADMVKPLTLTAWTSGNEPLSLSLLYHPLDPAFANQTHPRFLSYHTQPYRQDALPIQVTSLAPYAAVVESAQPGFLETHRFYVPGYRATVNGHRVAVTESPGHRAMVPLDRGRSEVRMDYPGPPAVRAAYWFSLAAWLAAGAWILGQAAVRARARFRLSPAA